MIKKFLCLLPTVLTLNTYALYSIEKDETQVIFWEVGQGNCTLIKTPEFDDGDNLTKKHITLIDGGSSEYPDKFNPKPKGDRAAQKVADEILDYLKDDEEDIEKHMNVILSHPDEDPICFVDSIVKEVKKKEKPALQFFIGKERTGWTTKVAEDILSYIDSLNLGADLMFSGDNLHNHNIELGNTNNINFLFGQKIKSKETNDHSLVVRYRFGNISALVPGDATHKTALQIPKPQSPVTIALASHHGAYGGNEKCNSSAWVDMFQPKYVVLSTSAVNDKFKHPRLEAVRQYLPYVTTMKHPHYLTCFADLSAQAAALTTSIKTTMSQGVGELIGADLTFHSIEALYPPIQVETNKAIYSTANSGDVVFTWGVNSTDPKIKLERR